MDGGQTSMPTTVIEAFAGEGSAIAADLVLATSVDSRSSLAKEEHIVEIVRMVTVTAAVQAIFDSRDQPRSRLKRL
jgi:hypothetical protein